MAPAGGLEAKHYILAALTATLVAAAIVVTVVSVVLSPSSVSFRVTEARNISQLHTSGGGQLLVLTVAASNPSQRGTRACSWT